MGVEMDGDLRAWGNAQRRVGSLLAFGVAVAFLVGALVAFFLDAPAWLYWAFLVVVALALVFEVLLLVLRPAAPRVQAQAEAVAAPAVAPEPSPYAPPAEQEPQQQWAPPAPAPAPPPVRTLTLRCSDCGTVFDISDTGDRPLRHTCPGCGAEGMLREEGAAPMLAADPAPVEAAAPAAAQPAKRLKLRCGGCKEVFAIEDSGERPLRRPCPYCGRTGEVR